MINSNLSVKYNDQDDYMYVMVNGTYKRYKKLGFKETYIVKDGVIPTEYDSLWNKTQTTFYLNGNQLQIEAGVGTSGYRNCLAAIKMNLTNFDSVTFSNLYNSCNARYLPIIGIFNTFDSSDVNLSYSLPANATQSSWTFDVSTLEGEFYVGLTAWNLTGTRYTTCVSSILLK